MGGCSDGNGGFTYFCNATWRRHLQAITDSGDNGVYTGADLDSISFDSNIVPAWRYHAGDRQTWYYGLNGAKLVGMVPGASVTIQDGAISAMSFAAGVGDECVAGVVATQHAAPCVSGIDVQRRCGVAGERSPNF